MAVDLEGDALPDPFTRAVGNGRWRSSGDVRVLAWSPDCRYVLGAGPDTTRVWSAEDGRVVKALDVRGVTCAAWSVRGDRLLLGSREGRCVWLAAQPQTVHAMRGLECLALSRWEDQFRIVERVSATVLQIRSGTDDRSPAQLAGSFDAAVLSDDGAWLAVSRKGGVDVYGLPALDLRCALDLPVTWSSKTFQATMWLDPAWVSVEEHYAVKALAFSADGNRLAILGTDSIVRSFELSSSAPEQTVAHADRAVALGPGGQVFSAMKDEPGLVAGTQRLQTTGPVQAISVSPNGEWLLASARCGQIFRWRLPGLEPLPLADEDPPSWVEAIAISADGHRVSIRREGAVTLIDRSTQRVLGRWPVDTSSPGVALRPRQDEVWAVSHLEVKTQSYALSRFVASQPKAQPLGDRASVPMIVSSLGWTPDGQLVAAAFLRPVVKIWTADGALAATVECQAAQRVCFSADGATLAVAETDGRVHLVARSELTRHRVVKPGRTLATSHDAGSHAPNDAVRALAFSADGQSLISGWNEVVRVWDLRTGELRLQTQSLGKSSTVLDAAFAPDGSPCALFVCEPTLGKARYDWWTPRGFVPICGSPPAVRHFFARGAIVPGCESVLLVLDDQRLGEVPVPVTHPLEQPLRELAEALAMVGDGLSALDHNYTESAQALFAQADAHALAAWAKQPDALAAVLPSLGRQLASGRLGWGWSGHADDVEAALLNLKR